jgi:hypothetical protein
LFFKSPHKNPFASFFIISSASPRF